MGFDVKDYLVHVANSQKPISAEELGQDYSAIAQVSAAQPGVDSKARLILAGWSLGAGYSLLVASQPQFVDHVDRVVAISPPRYNELAWKPTDALIYFTHGTPREKVFDARQYVKKLDLTPFFIINATDDDTSPLSEAKEIFEAAPLQSTSTPSRLMVIISRVVKQNSIETWTMDFRLKPLTPTPLPALTDH